MRMLPMIPIRPRRPRRAPVPPPPDGDPEELPCGCGWFESTHDLRQGLQVLEVLEPQERLRVGLSAEGQTTKRVLPFRAP